ncbi:MAG TPA: hypothetical protein VD963_02165 [Phycisphaerales bacterium]|nr:hypothetical protein [Phycisphaerales bacterium]
MGLSKTPISVRAPAPATVKAVRQRFFETEAVSARLRAVVAAYHYKELAKLLGLSGESTRRYLIGDPPSVEFVMCVALNFGVSLNWILLGRGPIHLDESEPLPPTRSYKDVLLERVAGAVDQLHEDVVAVQGLLARRGEVTPGDIEVVVGLVKGQAFRSRQDDRPPQERPRAQRKQEGSPHLGSAPELDDTPRGSAAAGAHECRPRGPVRSRRD